MSFALKILIEASDDIKDYTISEWSNIYGHKFQLFTKFMEHKPIRKKQRKYDAGFKKEVLKMIESGRPVPEVAQSLGIGSNLIYFSKKQLLKPDVKNRVYTAVVYDEEKSLLQKRIKELETERDILKKALGIFSRPI